MLTPRMLIRSSRTSFNVMAIFAPIITTPGPRLLDKEILWSNEQHSSSKRPPLLVPPASATLAGEIWEAFDHLTTERALMSHHHHRIIANHTGYWIAIAVFLTLSAFGQQQGAGGAAGRTGTRSSSGSSRQYPSTGTIGDAYYSIDPETRRVVTIADEDTSKYISQVLSNLDRPKPQVLIKVVFLEVTRNDALDFGIEGGWTRPAGSDPIANAANVFGLSGLNQSPTNTPLNPVGQPLSSFQSTAS